MVSARRRELVRVQDIVFFRSWTWVGSAFAAANRLWVLDVVKVEKGTDYRAVSLAWDETVGNIVRVFILDNVCGVIA